MFLKLGGFEISRLFLVAFVYFLTRGRVQIWKRSEKVVHSCSVRISHDRLQNRLEKGKWPEPLDISENFRDDSLREARGWRRSVSQVGSRGEASA